MSDLSLGRLSRLKTTSRKCIQLGLKSIVVILQKLLRLCNGKWHSALYNRVISNISWTLKSDSHYVMCSVVATQCAFWLWSILMVYSCLLCFFRLPFRNKMSFYKYIGDTLTQPLLSSSNVYRVPVSLALSLLTANIFSTSRGSICCSDAKWRKKCTKSWIKSGVVTWLRFSAACEHMRGYCVIAYQRCTRSQIFKIYVRSVSLIRAHLHYFILVPHQKANYKVVDQPPLCLARLCTAFQLERIFAPLFVRIPTLAFSTLRRNDWLLFFLSVERCWCFLRLAIIPPPL